MAPSRARPGSAERSASLQGPSCCWNAIERDLRRPEALTWRALAAVCGGALTIALVGNWLIAQAPAVQELGRRVSKLDDEQIGRVTRIERRLEVQAPGWGAVIVLKSKQWAVFAKVGFSTV